MDRIIEVKVRGNHLSSDNNIAGLQYEGNVTFLRIEFDKGWDNYTKTVNFFDAYGQNPVKRILTADLLEDITESTRIYLCAIPPEPLMHDGKMEYVIEGYHDGKRQRAIEAKLKVLPSPYIDNAGEPTDPTPSQAEQIQGQIENILSDMQAEAIRAETARTGAEEAQAAAEVAAGNAETAEYNAEEAQKAAENARDEAQRIIENAEEASVHYPYIDEETSNWMVWDTGKGEYVDSGVSAKGIKGDKGDKGDKGAAGDGSGDMTKDVYDPQGKATDIFAEIEKKADISMVVTITGDETNGYTMDKACDEIRTAYANGQTVIAKKGAHLFTMSACSSSANGVIIFEQVHAEFIKVFEIYTDYDITYYEYALNEFAPKTMVVTVTGNDTDGYTSDKTFAEIKAYVDAGGEVIAKRVNAIHQLIVCSAVNAKFAQANAPQTCMINISRSDKVTVGVTTLVEPSALADYLPLTGGTLIGVVQAPTAEAGTNSDQIATTAFVQNAFSDLPTGGLSIDDFTFSTVDIGAGSAATTKFYAVYEE